MQGHYKLPQELYQEIKKALNYDSAMCMEGIDEFMQQLPPTLRMAVSVSIHRKTFLTDPFFKELGDSRMLSFVGQRLRPQFFQTGEYLYRQADEILTFKIFTKGMAAFIHPRFENKIFAIVDPGDALKYPKSSVMKNCGFEDTVLNICLFIKMIQEKKLKYSEIS